MPITLPTSSPTKALVSSRRPAVCGANPRGTSDGCVFIDSRRVYTPSGVPKRCRFRALGSGFERRPQKPGVFLEFRDDRGEQVDGVRVRLALGCGARGAQLTEMTGTAVHGVLSPLDQAEGSSRISAALSSATATPCTTDAMRIASWI